MRTNRLSHARSRIQSAKEALPIATLTKFPVTSPTGAEYRVDIRHESLVHYFAFDKLKIRVYRPNPRNGWFQRKWLRVVDREYSLDYGSVVNYVETAQNHVLDYEKARADEIERGHRSVDAVIEFHAWDGEIRVAESQEDA